MVKVSVVMATYNGEKYIREQLDSILAQTYPIYEIIIQDDCSTDRTVEIVESYLADNTSIKLEINEQNLGYNANFKKAVMRSSGDLVALADQDDVWFNDKIESQVLKICDKTMCYSSHYRGTNAKDSRVVRYKCAPERQLFDPIVGHSMLLRGDFVRNPENWLQMVDFDYSLGINAHLQGGAVMVDRPLEFHRVHPGEVTFANNPPTYRRWYPYLHGLRAFRTIRKKARYIQFFSTIAERSEVCAGNGLVHELCLRMLGKGVVNYIALSFLCMRHFKTVCPGGASIVRGFFHPLIYASYHRWE